MKHGLKFLLTVTALGLQVTGHAAVTLTDAKITQIIRDVRTIDPGKAARPAVMRETVQGEQGVRTGIESRTELLFNDHTITRLGANTHFSFSEGTRNMSLQSGVMLLQVPKGIGGATIETPAVTAGVTGTTIMLDVGKDLIKLIVLEGKCCLWFNNDKGLFKHKYWAVAGQEIILRIGANKVSPPVFVNLKLLESTSLLLTGKWGSPLDTGPLIAAANGQKPQNYSPGNLAAAGAGADVVVTQGKITNNPPTPPPQTDKTNPQPSAPATRPPTNIIP